MIKFIWIVSPLIPMNKNRHIWGNIFTDSERLEL